MANGDGQHANISVYACQYTDSGSQNNAPQDCRLVLLKVPTRGSARGSTRGREPVRRLSSACVSWPRILSHAIGNKTAAQELIDIKTAPTCCTEIAKVKIEESSCVICTAVDDR